MMWQAPAKLCMPMLLPLLKSIIKEFQIYAYEISKPYGIVAHLGPERV